MNEIKCPKCSEIFQIDEIKFASIAKQVRDQEFDKELTAREKAWKESEAKSIELAKAQIASEVATLEGKVKEAQAMVQNQVVVKEKEIEKLQGMLNVELEKRTAVINEKNLAEKQQKEVYEQKLKEKDVEIAYYKDFKAKQSTKLVGESLEKHCEFKFEEIRAIAFPNAVFEKDNDAKTGSKGDYIYKEFDLSGVEILSIMFEMKNEADETATKKTNEAFLKELDKDRAEKGCEYAVLVSLLEQENELYNNGIVDKSHRYPKMYVIRPQFFIPVISFLRNAAMNALGYKKELAVMRSQNTDIINFETQLKAFKDDCAYNYRLAGTKSKEAVDGIDKTIKELEKIKKALLGLEDNIRIASEKADKITIKRLTKNNPTMEKRFAEIAAADDE